MILLEIIGLILLGFFAFFLFLWGLEVRLNRHEARLIEMFLSVMFMFAGLVGLTASFIYLVVH